ncbi:hypothetical protein FPSE_00602 [Fusarium pseudograminearum CS3096]|uniref:Uncharacterized protein n=1 Tax=Fusarium pseudograminearum (strain CS3096) TaxID=1028729 RepID=K3V253_FUSPC|nr:hypothetical protein FPSE_00602 [Fusarium pseudograminearum CS3096]EKJ79291.1 hypothetical protein FPSE_00602 [Fusarium pseudograminearum CS3096]
MSGGPSTRSQATGVVNTVCHEPDYAVYTFYDISDHAAWKSISLDFDKKEELLMEFYWKTENIPPSALEPNLRNIDFTVQQKVGTVHHTQRQHFDHTSCLDMYLRLAYYPQTTHESHQTAAFCFEYRIQKPNGMDERASAFHLQLCEWRFSQSVFSTRLQTLVDSLRLGERLDEFNCNLAVLMAIEIKRQIRDTEQYTCLADYTDAFINVREEVERFAGFWGELKDDVYRHLVTDKNTYFDSRDIGLFI